MKITYLGHSCFIIENQAGLRIITDPYTKVGYELPQGLKADIALISHGHFDHNYIAAIEDTPIVVDQVGESCVKGVAITGEHSWHDPRQGALRGDNIVFKFVVDGVTFCHFGDLGEEYSEEMAKKIIGADVWLLPVGGTYTIDAAQALEYIQKMKPKAVIPMHYRPNDGALDIAGIDKFFGVSTNYPIVSYEEGVFVFDKDDTWLLLLLLLSLMYVLYNERTCCLISFSGDKNVFSLNTPTSLLLLL